MFEALSDRFDGIFSGLRSKGRLSDGDVDEALREIRLALLEADVNFAVVKAFVERVRTALVGEVLSEALNPAQQVIKAVHQELVSTLGGERGICSNRILVAPYTALATAGMGGTIGTSPTPRTP